VDNKSPGGVGGSLGAPEWKEGIIFELSCVVGKKLEEALGASLNGGGCGAATRGEGESCMRIEGCWTW
jgi:hypothetical protein